MSWPYVRCITLDHITLRRLKSGIPRICHITAEFAWTDYVPAASLPGGNSVWEPPESISNSEVKTHSADDSVGSPHVKVGHCQAY